MERATCETRSHAFSCCRRRSALAYIEKEKPTVLCLQETKTQTADDAKWKAKLGNWPFAYFSCSADKGHHGTAVLSRVKPAAVHYGLDASNAHESDGRVIILEFKEVSRAMYAMVFLCLIRNFTLQIVLACQYLCS